MSKKLETLLEAIEVGSWVPIRLAYHAYIEERNTIPQAGQEIEVTDGKRWPINPLKEKFVGFCSDGKIVTEDEYGIVTAWESYRITVAKKKWKVVIGANGLPFNILEEDYIAGDIITTFEY
jgi:uncharacterized protein YifE (UPF0438 family)